MAGCLWAAEPLSAQLKFVSFSKLGTFPFKLLCGVLTNRLQQVKQPAQEAGLEAHRFFAGFLVRLKPHAPSEQTLDSETLL